MWKTAVLEENMEKQKLEEKRKCWEEDSKKKGVKGKSLCAKKINTKIMKRCK